MKFTMIYLPLCYHEIAFYFVVEKGLYLHKGLANRKSGTLLNIGFDNDKDIITT